MQFKVVAAVFVALVVSVTAEPIPVAEPAEYVDALMARARTKRDECPGSHLTVICTNMGLSACCTGTCDDNPSKVIFMDCESGCCAGRR